MKRLAAFALVALLAGLAQAQAVDRVQAMREAAARIALVQQARGIEAAMELVQACHLDARRNQGSYNQDVEICVTWDYYVTLNTVAQLAQKPPDWLAQNKVDLRALNNAMVQRLLGTFAYYELTPDEMARVTNLLNANAMQAGAAALAPR